jgi:excisionase family DNA binding protein
MPKVTSSHSWRTKATPEGTFGWSVPQYAQLWGVTRGTVHNWLRKGELSSVKIGGTRRVLPSHHDEFCRRHESEAFA